MTRLTADDVRDQQRRLTYLDKALAQMCALDLRGLALRTACLSSEDRSLEGARVAAVPITTGQGLIGGFAMAVTATLAHLGCEAWTTRCPDVAGIQEATQAGAQVLFLADDRRFIALNVHDGHCADNDLATADGYVTALEAAARGLEGRRVLLLGLGPIGRTAAAGLLAAGACVSVVEPDEARRMAALADTPQLQAVSLAEGLATCDLIFDATPAAAIIDAGEVRATTIAVAPGVPSGFTARAQALLGPRHLHDPLAIGVAVMAVRTLT